eukprot:766577-Hanusia_phi.AAC.4
MDVATENVNGELPRLGPSPECELREKAEGETDMTALTEEQKFEIRKFIEACHTRLHSEHVTMLETQMFENKNKIDALLRECKSTKMGRGLSGQGKSSRRSYSAAFSEQAACIFTMSDSEGGGDATQKQLIHISPDGVHVHALVDGTHTVPVKASLTESCNNISFNLARDSTGEIDIEQLDDTAALWDGSLRGKLGILAKLKPYQSLITGFGPFGPLQQSDRINLELEVNKKTSLTLYRNGKFVCELNIEIELFSTSDLGFVPCSFADDSISEGDGAEIRSFSSRCLPLKKPTSSENKCSYIIHQARSRWDYWSRLSDV